MALDTIETQQANMTIAMNSFDILSHTTSVGITEALTSASSAVTAGRSAQTRIDETNKRLGPLTEQVIRSRISVFEGLTWSEPIRIKSLNDLVCLGWERN